MPNSLAEMFAEMMITGAFPGLPKKPQPEGVVTQPTMETQSSTVNPQRPKFQGGANLTTPDQGFQSIEPEIFGQSWANKNMRETPPTSSRANTPAPKVSIGPPIAQSPVARGGFKPPSAPPPLAQTFVEMPKDGTVPGTSAAPAAPRAASPSVAPEKKGGAPSSAPRTQSSQGGTGSPPTVPPGSSTSPDVARFLIQAGISLMTPSWGGPMANVGRAIGEGAEAVTRGSQADQQEQIAARKMAQEDRRIANSERERATSSSRAKKLTPLQEFTQGMSPEAAMYFTQRLKTVNRTEEDEDGNPVGDPVANMDKILQETRTLDLRTRAQRGQARAAEILDGQIKAAISDPATEQSLLGFVAANPAERQILLQRIENARQAQAKK